MTTDCWKTIKLLNGEQKTTVRDIYNLDNEWVRDKELCEKLNQFFTKIGGTPTTSPMPIPTGRKKFM